MGKHFAMEFSVGMCRNVMHFGKRNAKTIIIKMNANVEHRSRYCFS